MKKRKCSKCGKEKPATLKYFHRAKFGKYGISSVCKKCSRKYYLTHVGLNKNRRYKDKKKCTRCDKIKPRKEFHWSNKKANIRKAKCKQCRSELNYNPLSNRNVPLEIRKLRRLKKKREWYKEAFLKNPYKFRKYTIQRRVRIKKANGFYTNDDWQEKIKYYGSRCVYCGIALSLKEITTDHKIPLSKGGSNWLSNLAPACHQCNSGKRDKKYYVPSQNHA